MILLRSTATPDSSNAIAADAPTASTSNLAPSEPPAAAPTIASTPSWSQSPVTPLLIVFLAAVPAATPPEASLASSTPALLAPRTTRRPWSTGGGSSLPVDDPLSPSYAGLNFSGELPVNLPTSCAMKALLLR